MNLGSFLTLVTTEHVLDFSELQIKLLFGFKVEVIDGFWHLVCLARSFNPS